MPTLLDDRLVSDALTALTDWRGDAQRICRTISVNTGHVDALLGQIQEAADSMNHHPKIERSGDAVTFTLWTHSAGGVTEYDIALASRIDDLITRAEGVGTVAGAPTAEGLGAGTVGPGLRHGGGPRRDVHVPTTADETAGEPLQPGTRAEPGDRFEPFVGAPAAQGTPIVPMPDTVPNEPQPGVARPEGQGTPPAGQNVEEGDDRGGYGDQR